ncbi:MAG: hypothetical protein RJA52_928 [Bacteroidota bacterium]|jgi:hypothetical protein
MIHPCTKLQYINDEMGYGVFASVLIPKGTIVYVKDPLEIEIDEDTFNGYPEVLQNHIEKYSYIDERGIRIISWDMAKYVNHCCDFNTISTGYGFEIAVRDILPGEEITDEYGLFNMGSEMVVGCNKPNCRGRVSAVDADLYWEKWDNQIKDALIYFNKVDQPLLPLVEEDIQKNLFGYLNSVQPYQSVHSLKRRMAM